MLALCIALLFGCARAAVSVRMTDGAALLEASGDVIVPLDIYEDIVPLSENMFAARLDGCYALMDGQGITLTGAVYGAMRLSGTVVIAERDGLLGLLSRDGGELGAFDYTRIVTSGDGNFWALKGDPNDQESDELFVLDEFGNETATGLMVRGTGDTAGDGLLAVLLPEEGLWGYCDARGNMAVPAVYESAGRFISGCAAVTLDGGFGAIDANGDMVVSAEYDYLEVSPSGFILAARTGEGVWAFDLTGRELAFHPGEEVFAYPVGNGYAVNDGERLVLLDTDGRVIAEAEAGAVFMDGLNGQVIISEGAWGEECVYISGTQARRQNLYPLGSDEDGRPLYAFMQVNTARYMNDLLGEIQLAADMDSARYGVVDGSGEELVPAEYASVEYIGEGRLLAQIDGLWQMIDSGGTVYWSHGVRQSEEPSF